MWKKLRQIKRRTLELLGLDRMSPAFHTLTINYLFLMIYYTLESVFVNTLLYRLTGDMMDIIKYRAVAYVFMAVGMNIGAFIARKRSPVSTIRLGGFSYICMYMLLFFGMNHVIQLKYIAAVLSGSGAGLYWTGQNILITHYTNKHNRAVGVSIQGVVQGVMTLLVPVISGFVISLLPGNNGYRVMFGIGMLAVLAQGRFQKQLMPVTQKTHKSEIRLAWKLVWRKATTKLMLGAEMVRGFRDGTFNFFLNMLLFQIITDEGLVGINTFFTGAMAIFGSWAYGKLSVPRWHIKLMLIATTILTGGLLIQLKFFNAATVMIFSAVNAFVNLFILYTVNTYSYNVMGQNEIMRQCMGEMSGFRETALSLGRLLGLCVVTLFPPTVDGYLKAMIVLTASQYLAVLLVKLIRDVLERKAQRGLI